MTRRWIDLKGDTVRVWLTGCGLRNVVTDSNSFLWKIESRLSELPRLVRHFMN